MTSVDPHRPGTPEDLTERDLEQRAELAGALGKEVWPATADRLREVAAEHGASDAVLGRLSALPGGRTYANVSEVWTTLTGHREQHRF